jgi:hypothetical protein
VFHGRAEVGFHGSRSIFLWSKRSFHINFGRVRLKIQASVFCKCSNVDKNFQILFHFHNSMSGAKIRFSSGVKRKLMFHLQSHRFLFSETSNFYIDTTFLLNTNRQNSLQLRIFSYCRETIQSLKVVNDGAERGIALATELNSKPLTHNENE